MALIFPLEGQEGDDYKALPKLLLNVPEQPKNSDSEMSTDNGKDESGSSTESYEAQGQVGACYYARHSPSNGNGGLRGKGNRMYATN